MLGNLIGGFVTILVGTSLLPSVADQVFAAQNGGNSGDGGNLTGSANTIVGLVPLFFALGVMSAGVAITAQGLRAAGMLV